MVLMLVLAIGPTPAQVQAAAQEQDGTPRILTSIRPLHSIASFVMGGDGTGAPELLITGGASPHFYALKPSDARKLAEADVVFWIGPGLETFLENPLETVSAGARVVTLMQAPGLVLLPLRRGGVWASEHDHEQDHGDEDEDGLVGIDPHIWLDPNNAAVIARTMAETLGARDPSRAAQYRNNAEDFAQEMTELDANLRRQLAPVTSRPYILFHDAYQYFEARYGLTPSGSLGVASDRPVGMRRILDIRDRIGQSRQICVFSAPQFRPKLVAALTEHAEAKVAILDDVGTEIPPGPNLYDTLLTRMADAYSSCLRP